MHLLKTPFLLLLIIITTLSLVGCGDPVKEQIEQQLPMTEQRVAQLGDALNNGQVRNASLIKKYADTVMVNKANLAPLINEFRKDASTDGPMYKSLLDRINTAKNQPQMFESSQALYNELLNIYQAADPVLYSDALSDPLNVLADMSDGQLPRINSLSKSQSQQANNAQDFGTGEQLIGNPSYGNWQTGSNGMSFWAWYGMYSMMGDMFGRRTSYNDWGRQRNYSYYNDYGRTRYSSPSQLKKQTSLDTRTKKSFSSRGQKFTSPYSKNRAGSSSLSSQSKTAQTSANRFRTNSVKKSNYASKSKSKNSSFRNSNTNTSRGFRRGK
ncbi:putative lipoprotein [Colwellia psychrerythraea 34H]|uniref:Putative lipoprotein n=2 Tax=Colwellia psychrerythraea TaxID=28229 RepID=Q47WI5_COLP3|nr:putative lipoprotein [Colwellia psychrerythraea 34H]